MGGRGGSGLPAGTRYLCAPFSSAHQRTDLVLGGTLPALTGEEIGVS